MMRQAAVQQCLYVLVFLITFFLLGNSFEVRVASVFKADDGSFSIRAGIHHNGVAYGTFENSLNTTGWGVLHLTTNKNYDDNDQMYGAGFLESYLTVDRIYEHAQNMMKALYDQNPPSKDLLRFLNDQEQWVRESVKKNNTQYWKQVSLVMSQYDGLLAGYKNFSSPEKQLNEFYFQNINSYGEIWDISAALNRTNWLDLTPEEFELFVAERGHCSSIVKLTPDFEELIAGHSTWTTYFSMNRIFKHYQLSANLPSTRSRKVSFASYPGVLHSWDDFYITETGLAVMETTNNIYNTSLYDFVSPQSLLSWQRARIANTMASDGKSWKDFFSPYNSGTYNNQWIVVDFKKFSPSSQLGEGVLWIIEQIPGYIVGADMTEVLKLSHWPSYNVPFFPFVYNISGYPAMVQKFGDKYSYNLAPRGEIFRRDAGKLDGFVSSSRFLRYNDYHNDPFSLGNAYFSICSRGDLLSTPRLFGCTDTKLTSSKLISSLSTVAINGPTLGNQLPQFDWRDYPNATHLGIPDVLDFDFQMLSFYDEAKR